MLKFNKPYKFYHNFLSWLSYCFEGITPSNSAIIGPCFYCRFDSVFPPNLQSLNFSNTLYLNV